MTKAPLLLLALSLAACCTSQPAQSSYDRHIGVYRAYYDNLLHDQAAYLHGRPYHRDFVDAVRGDPQAAHRLFTSEYGNQAGEFGANWSQHCWVLLLKIGDQRFYELLSREDRKTQEGIAWIVVSQMVQPEFPRTTQLAHGRSR